MLLFQEKIFVLKTPDPKKVTRPTVLPRKVVLPPLQVKRSLNPNSNYYRKISADFHKREALRRAGHVHSPIHQRLSILENIKEEGNMKRKQQFDNGMLNDFYFVC